MPLYIPYARAGNMDYGEHGDRGEEDGERGRGLGVSVLLISDLMNSGPMELLVDCNFRSVRSLGWWDF